MLGLSVPGSWLAGAGWRKGTETGSGRTCIQGLDLLHHAFPGRPPGRQLLGTEQPTKCTHTAILVRYIVLPTDQLGF